MYMFELDKVDRIAKETEPVFGGGGDSLSETRCQDVRILSRCSNGFLSHWHCNKAGTPSFSIELAVLALACPGPFEDTKTLAETFNQPDVSY